MFEARCMLKLHSCTVVPRYYAPLQIKALPPFQWFTHIGVPASMFIFNLACSLVFFILVQVVSMKSETTEGGCFRCNSVEGRGGVSARKEVQNSIISPLPSFSWKYSSVHGGGCNSEALQ